MSGKIHRLKKESDFVVLDNHALRNNKLSWKGKGLHCYLMHLPEDWQVNIADLQNRSEDGRDSTADGLKELITEGYVTRERVVDDKTKQFVGYDYNVYERPEYGIAENGKPVNGFSEYGIAENGKPVTNKNRNKLKLNKQRIEGGNAPAPAPGVEPLNLNTHFLEVPATPLSPAEAVALEAQSVSEAKQVFAAIQSPRWTPTNPDAEIAEMLKCPLCEERFVRDVRQRVTEFPKFAERFLLKVKSEGATHANRKDLRSHFFAWARLEAERSHGKPGIQNDKPAPTFVNPQTPVRFAK